MTAARSMSVASVLHSILRILSCVSTRKAMSNRIKGATSQSPVVSGIQNRLETRVDI